MVRAMAGMSWFHLIVSGFWSGFDWVEIWVWGVAGGIFLMRYSYALNLGPWHLVVLGRLG